MGDIDLLKYWKPIDFVSPIEAALRLHETKQNAETQRMFAQNTMARESAAEARAKQEHDEKRADLERQRKIDAANALAPGGAIGQALRQSPGSAMAIADAMGIPLSPLHAAVAGPPPPIGDAVDQVLAPELQGATGGGTIAPSSGPGAGAAGSGSPVAPAAHSVTSGGAAPVFAGSQETDPGVAAIMAGRTVQGAPDGDYVLPADFHPAGNMQDAMNHTGFVPRGSELLPPQAGVPGAAPPPAAADLEALMSRAAPGRPAPAAPEAPSNPLYDAVLGGKHYQLSAAPITSGLEPKYEAIYQHYMSLPNAHPTDAFKAVLAEKEKDDAQAATEHRMMAVMGGRNAEADKRDATYRMTVEQQQARDQARMANAQAVARIKAAAMSPGLNPKAQQFLAQALGMAESGASDQEIAAAGAAAHVDPKVWTGQVNAEDRKANADLRSTDRRAALEVVDENGKSLGPATSPQAATDMRKKIQAWSQLKNRYQALIDDVRQNGDRELTPDAIQRRNSLAASAAAAARVYNGLGATDASQKLEAEILGSRGTPGHGLLMGANLGVLQHVMDEAGAQHQARLNTTLRPGGGRPLPAAITHDKAAHAPGGDLDKWLTERGF